jgi:hypothetical protein
MAELVGFELDPWQRLVIEGACGIRHDGKWAAKRVGVNVPRQNGKGGILELIELTALFTWGDELVIHSAHEFITSQKHSMRLWGLVEQTPDLLRQVYKQRLVGTHGQEAVKLLDGRMIEFRSRTKAGGRGFSCDHLFLDEAMILPEDALAALLPTLRARPDPQIWYTGSAVDQERDRYGMVFTRLRMDALERRPDLAYFEWSLPLDHPDEMTQEDFDSEEAMWQSNPAFGIRIFREHFDMENEALDKRSSAVELYGVGDYPDPNASADRPISPEQWAECEDAKSEIVSNLCFAFDVSPERRSTIACAGLNQDGRWHVEVLEKLPGTGWVPSRLLDLQEEHDPHMIVCDGLGPGASIAAKCDEIGVAVTKVDGGQHAQACGLMVEQVAADNLRHLGSTDLWNAVRAAGTRPLGDRWLWSRRKSSADISPLVAATLAVWAAMAQPEETGEVDIY